MKTLMATAAAVTLLAGVSVATAQNAPASNDKGSAKMEQSAAPKVKAPVHKRMHHAMRTRHFRASETTGAGGHRIGTIGGPRNDPSFHQSAGDRDSRDFPKKQY